MASPVELFCWRHVGNETLWHQEGPGHCSFGSIQKELMFSLVSHVLLALVSALYLCLDHTNERPTGSTLKRSATLHVRLAIAVSSALVPALGPLLVQFTSSSRSAPADLLLDGTSSIAWLLMSLYLWKLRQQSVRLVRTHKPVMLVWSLTFVSQCVRLSMVINRILEDTSSTVEKEGIVVASSILQVMFMLTLLPTPGHTVVYHTNGDGLSACPIVKDNISGDSKTSKESAGKPSDSNHLAAEHASLFSKLTFGWVQDIMRKGANGQLKKASDVYKLPEKLTSSHVENYFSRFYSHGSTAFAEDVFDSKDSTSSIDSQRTNTNPVRNRYSGTQASSVKQEDGNIFEMPHDDNPKRISLCRALFRAFGVQIFLVGIFRLLSNICMFASPLLLHALLSYLENSNEPVRNGYFYAFGLCIATGLRAIINSHSGFRLVQLEMQLLAAVMTTLYRKTLAVGSRALSTFTTGQITNMLNVDARRIAVICHCVHDAWSVLLELAVILYLLYQQVNFKNISESILVINIPIDVGFLAKVIFIIRLDHFTVMPHETVVISSTLYFKRTFHT